MDQDEPLAQLAIGQRLAGRYRVEALLGQGGMAEVYRGLDERLARPVALKVLLTRFAHDPELRTRFEEEARAAAMISHPNVVSVYDAGEDAGRAFIVMELVTGETLAAVVSRGPMEIDEVRRLGEGVLDALAAAHAGGLLHRDIKPANILLGPDDTPRVVDFGIAKAAQDAGEDTTANVVFGTPMYLAPERAMGGAATVRSDLWSVGVVLYEMLTGRRPFEAESALASSLAASEGRYRRLSEVRPEAGAALSAVVDRALSPDPANRFASALEMAGALKRSEPEAATVPMEAGGATLAEEGATAVIAPLDAAGATRMMTITGGTVHGAPRGLGAGALDPEAPPDRAAGRRPRSNGPIILAATIAALIAVIVVLALIATKHLGPSSPSRGSRPSTSRRTGHTTSSLPRTSSSSLPARSSTSSTSSTTSSSTSTTSSTSSSTTSSSTSTTSSTTSTTSSTTSSTSTTSTTSTTSSTTTSTTTTTTTQPTTSSSAPGST